MWGNTHYTASYLGYALDEDLLVESMALNAIKIRLNLGKEDLYTSLSIDFCVALF